MKVIQAKDYAQLSRKAAAILCAQITLKEDCVLGLATESLPSAHIKIWQTLARRVRWIFPVPPVNLDEYRGLSGDHPKSYRYFMETNMFSHINIQPGNAHLPAGDCADAASECAAYDALISRLGGIDTPASWNRP